MSVTKMRTHMWTEGRRNRNVTISRISPSHQLHPVDDVLSRHLLPTNNPVSPRLSHRRFQRSCRIEHEPATRRFRQRVLQRPFDGERVGLLPIGHGRFVASADNPIAHAQNATGVGFVDRTQTVLLSTHFASHHELRPGIRPSWLVQAVLWVPSPEEAGNALNGNIASNRPDTRCWGDQSSPETRNSRPSVNRTGCFFAPMSPPAHLTSWCRHPSAGTGKTQKSVAYFGCGRVRR
jgi:hypothetical protein